MSLTDINFYESKYDLPPKNYYNLSGSATHWLDDQNNFSLKAALETAASSHSKIEEEQERLYRLLEEAMSDTERAAREYQIWYVKEYLNRASEIANKRLEYFKSLNSQADFDAENKRCAEDKAYWFEMYAWGYDPRARTPLATVPFELFPKQKDLVEWLDDIVFYRRTSGLVEKSRDEGATELFVRWCIHNWRYTDSFSALLSTRKEEEIDTKKKQGTLFERARLQIRLLPDWMLPEEFDIIKNLLPDKLITNPENKNAILGEAPVERIGSGDRVTVALFDEHAFWRFSGYPQYRSMSQTTDSIISVSSVGGKLNQFADLAFDGVTRKFILDWRDHPLKDKRWYDSLPFGYIAPKMTRTTIAQEVDRDYDASQPGKVWNLKEEFIFITRSEFLKPFIEAGLESRFFDEQGKFIIPHDWRITQTSDYGQTVGHEWSYGLFGQPSEYYPLSDTHFCFFNQNLEPTGLTTQEAVKEWRKVHEHFGLRKGNQILKPINFSYISHEQDGKKIAAGEKKGLRTILREKYGEIWRAWIPDYTTGIQTLEDWWTPVDKHLPNPFRPELMGRCQLIFVAPDGEYQMAFNERLSTYFVTVGQTEWGFHTARKQYSAYHYPESELGKAVKAMRPVKEFDDLVDNTRGYAVMWNIKPFEMTEDEEYRIYIKENAPEVLPENIAQIEDEETKSIRIASQMYLRSQWEKEHNQPIYLDETDYDKWLRLDDREDYNPETDML
ncbi:MAG: hypothetical protein M3405_16510 [Acidobacteriota bacterium]|nr:hypothetical protein [Acidobacteriota bacterium]